MSANVFRGKLCATIAVSLIHHVFAGSLWAQGLVDQFQPERILLQLKIDTTYDDSESSLSELTQLIDFLPPRASEIRAGETLSEIIFREYRFGASNLPKLYEIIQDEIVQINGLATPESVQPGLILIPGLPKRALTKPGTKMINLVPALAEIDLPRQAEALQNRDVKEPADKLSWSFEGSLNKLRFSYSAFNRDASQSALVAFSVDEPSFEQLAVHPVFNSPDVQVVSNQVEVDFSGCDNTPNELIETFKPDLFSTLPITLQVAERRADLLVLDSCWPDKTEAIKARDFFQEISSRIRILLRMSQVPVTVPGSIPEPQNGHCKQVREALRGLENLDFLDRVNVVYLPLGKDQGAAAIFTEIVTLGQIIAILSDLDVAPTPDIIAKAQQSAREIVDALPAAAIDSKLISDKALIESVFTLIHFLNAHDPDRHVIVNESWTIPGEMRKFEPHGANGAFVVSAVGNVNGRNVFSKKIEFSRRSISQKDILAVMNMSSNGQLICNSSEVDRDEDLDLVNVVGFNGTLADGTSGTSFAAPRVAWFLAAGEALRKVNISSDAWAAKMGKRLKNVRRPLTGFNALFFEPTRYVESVLQER